MNSSVRCEEVGGTGGGGTPPPSTRRAFAAGAVALLVFHSVLLAWQAKGDSATWDEVGHFVAGLSHWYNGDFTLYRVNPPLVRLVAAIPVVLFQPRLNVGAYLPDVPRASPFERDDFNCGQQLAESLGARYFRLLTFSRWAVIPFSALGGWICYQWAGELFGGGAGLLAAAMWACCPNALAYGHLIVPDTGAAALGAAAAYLLWRWLRRPVWGRAVAAGVVLGLAQLTKTTWIILFALWPAMWLAYRLLQTGGIDTWRSRCEALQLGAMVVLAVWVMNLGYGFEGSFRPLGSFTFASRALSGVPISTTANAPNRESGNRFAGTWLGQIPVPLPSNYLRGVDFVKWEFEGKYWSYLNGEWRFGGWWYYYLYAMLVKEPLGTWFLALLAVGAVATTVIRGPGPRRTAAGRPDGGSSNDGEFADRIQPPCSLCTACVSLPLYPDQPSWPVVRVRTRKAGDGGVPASGLVFI
jgi:hypothetical protein